jgi:hypothetical protein
MRQENERKKKTEAFDETLVISTTAQIHEDELLLWLLVMILIVQADAEGMDDWRARRNDVRSEVMLAFRTPRSDGGNLRTTESLVNNGSAVHEVRVVG